MSSAAFTRSICSNAIGGMVGSNWARCREPDRPGAASRSEGPRASARRRPHTQKDTTGQDVHKLLGTSIARLEVVWQEPPATPALRNHSLNRELIEFWFGNLFQGATFWRIGIGAHLFDNRLLGFWREPDFVFCSLPPPRQMLVPQPDQEMLIRADRLSGKFHDPFFPFGSRKLGKLLVDTSKFRLEIGTPHEVLVCTQKQGERSCDAACPLK